MSQSLVDRLAAHVAALQIEQIPEAARATARQLVFDTIATAIGGYRTPLGQRAAAFGVERLPGNEALVIGVGRRASAEGAAFANATMAKILGMDDSHRTAGHIACSVVPAGRAVAGQAGTSGGELMAAIVGAYDVAVRLGAHVRHEQRRRGLDLKGTIGPLAAALAAGRCAGLAPAQLADALALAADMASGTEQYVYEPGNCDTKDLIAGFAARSGVFAVRLAAGGFAGPRGAIDGSYGFLQALGPGGDTAAGLFDDLGERFTITETAFKPHGGCRHTHQAVDAVQRLLADGPVDPATIERVSVRTYGYALAPHFRIDPDPPGRAVAGLSIRVATALALVRGSAWPADFVAWDDPAVRRLRHLVDVAVDPALEATYPDRNGCTVEVTLAGGATRSSTVPFARGEPEAPLSDDDLRVKAGALADGLLPADLLDALQERCASLERLAHTDDLLALTAAHLERSPS
jgi:2-methylcitrate dehydratase PrpD